MAYRRSKKNFGPNVIYCFLRFNGNELKHKFHGLVGPPAGIFEENNNLQNQEEQFWFLRMALNHDMRVPEYSRRSQLQESCLNIFHLPIFDRFMAYRSSKKNLGLNVIYCFLGYLDIIWRYHMVMWYGDIIWWCDIRHKRFDIWWVLKHKFHGLVGPPGAIFEKTTTCKSKKKVFEFQEWLYIMFW